MDNRALLFIILAAALCVAALFIQSYGNLSDIPEQPAVISYNAATAKYSAVAANGTLVYTLSDLSATLQSCIDYLPRPLDIELRLYGRHNLTQRILMYGGNLQLRGVQWGSTNNRSTTLYYTGGYTPYGVFLFNGTYSTDAMPGGVDYYTIRELKIYGNTAGCVAIIYCAGGLAHWEGHDIQVYAGNSTDNGYTILGGSITVTDNLYAEGFNRGFDLQNWDYYNTIKNCFAYSCKTNFYMSNLNGVDVYGLMAYTSSSYNGVTMVNCRDMNFYGMRAKSNKEYGVALSGCYRVAIYGANIVDNSQEANNTYSGVYFYSNGGTYSTYNSVIGGSIISTSTAKMQKYAVRENDTNQNYNLVSGVSFAGCGTDDISLQGVNSIERDCR